MQRSNVQNDVSISPPNGRSSYFFCVVCYSVFSCRAAELSASLAPHLEEPIEVEQDSPMENVDDSALLPFPNPDKLEARLESQETHKYLLAKSYLDCREFERCAAIFLPTGLPRGPLADTSQKPKAQTPLKSKGKGRTSLGSEALGTSSTSTLPRLSQKALFLALYARYLAGEKKKDEDSEMVLGPADRGSATNKELVGISTLLEQYFAARDPEGASGGWLEYLYGVVLAKGKNEDEAKRWLIKSVHLFPYNWSAWLELNGLVGSIEEVHCFFFPLLATSIWTLGSNPITEPSHTLIVNG